MFLSPALQPGAWQAAAKCKGCSTPCPQSGSHVLGQMTGTVRIMSEAWEAWDAGAAMHPNPTPKPLEHEPQILTPKPHRWPRSGMSCTRGSPGTTRSRRTGCPSTWTVPPRPTSPPGGWRCWASTRCAAAALPWRASSLVRAAVRAFNLGSDCVSPSASELRKAFEPVKTQGGIDQVKRVLRPSAELGMAFRGSPC